ncbi:hypothetical protein GPJ56_000322 [Histomonas meleagridis]|uniref:uncharacterized protein n=1 Tax=Histomonas meleagridis TaxID=135588 RepID=UPI003559AB96|nr:hypothetical protein GPJ56_000322 [Histomonas meleagridis]KAH0798405.1 hypothetical protein GO595_008797 [Histomonas meleagridis]
MGNSQSFNEQESDDKIRSNSSYFGDNGNFDDMDANEIAAAIQQLQVERMRKYNNKNTNPPPQRSTQLKTVISVSSPDPYIKNFNGNDFLCFGIKTEAPCKIVVVANGHINSFRIPVLDRTEFSIPIPEYSSFDVEITPNLKSVQSKPGFAIVSKHILNFRLLNDEDEMCFNFAQQQLIANQQIYNITVGKRCRVENSDVTGKCCICLKNDATVAIAPCGHNVLCDDCLESRQAKLHHCPYCNSLSSF